MNAQDYGRGSGFGNGWLRSGWALPLVIGLGLGALLFGLLPSMRWGMATQAWMGHGAGAYAPGYQQPDLPRTEDAPSAPQTRPDSVPSESQGRHGAPHGPGREQHAFGAGRIGGFLFPFVNQGLIAALAIGAGVWLLTRGRSGPGAPQPVAGPSAGPSGAAPTPPTAGEVRSHEHEAPTTGETRRL